MHRIAAILSLIPAILVAGAGIAAGGESTTRGELVGSVVSTHPSWFKTSFLDLADDAAEAGAAGKHVLLFFDSEGCPYCYRMMEESFKGAHEGFIRAHFDTIALDVRGDREIAFSDELRFTEKEAARQLGIRVTPTMLFLDANSKAVLRIDGYRSVADFEQLLSYVHERAYLETSLGRYLEAHPLPERYVLRDHPSFDARADLSAVGDGPLMVIFEDASCTSCDDLHDRVLSHPTTRSLMERMTVVRLDARSGAPIVDPEGNETTPRQWARALELSYRPGILLFDAGREVFRLDGYRGAFHFQQSLRWTVGREWRRYRDYREFARADREAILARGENVDVTF